MAQLYAICRQNGQIEVRHVQVNDNVRGQLGALFQAQEAVFRAGVTEEIEFTGDWKPENNELFVVRGIPEVQVALEAAAVNPIALPPLDPHDFQGQGVKGLFATVGNGQNKRLLIQNFGPQQLLSTKIAFLFDGDVFRTLTEPVFVLGSHVVASVNAEGEVRFKNFSMLRRVFDMTPVFREATNAELTLFCGHGSLSVANPQAFIDNADEGIRKHVLAISKAEVLETHPVATISTRANAIGFDITVQAGRIEIPADRKGAKALLSFLLNKVYLGPIDQQLFITNSNRPLD